MKIPLEVIVAPTDFSPCAEAGLRLAAELARRDGAELIVAHITELPAGLPADARIQPRGSGTAGSVAEHVRREVEARLDAIAAPLRAEGVRVRTEVAFGSPATALVELASGARADLIVIGTHGRSGWRRAWLGSVAERVIRASAIPVLTVRDANESPGEGPLEAERQLSAEEQG